MIPTNRRVLVTGGAGFIGSHIVDELIAGGVAVTVLDNLDVSAHKERPDYLNPNAIYVWGDVRNPDAWEQALAGVTDVCHQAGKVGLGVDFGDVSGYVSHNDVGMATGLHVLHNIKFTGRFVLASSMVVYGEGRYRCATHGLVAPAPRLESELQQGNFESPCPSCGASLVPESVPEDALLDPRNVYAATKLHQEYLLSAFVREHSVSATALRYHNVYGPRMPRNTPYAGVASIFRSALADHRAPKVTEDGNQMRNFVHVRDVAHANVIALIITDDSAHAEATRRGLVSYNVASQQPRSVGDMAFALAGAFGADQQDTRWPQVTGGYRLGDVRHVFASTEKANDLLGFHSTIGFEEGMREFATATLRSAV
jgi:dTDP-L-rhamnose 4-epimerase